MQSLIYSISGIKIKQEDIIKEIKKHKDLNSQASLEEIFNACGSKDVSLIFTRCGGARQIIEILGRNQPVMMGLKGLYPNSPNGQHIVMLVKAKYSFVTTDISTPPSGMVAFSEFTFWDPANGKEVTYKANDIEKKAMFTLSYNIVERTTN